MPTVSEKKTFIKISKCSASSKGHNKKCWWFQICFIFTPKFWGTDPIWREHMFQGVVQPPTRLPDGHFVTSNCSRGIDLGKVDLLRSGVDLFLTHFGQNSFMELLGSKRYWVVVSNVFYFHPYLGKIPILTNIFQMGWNHQPGYWKGTISWEHAFKNEMKDNNPIKHVTCEKTISSWCSLLFQWPSFV